MIRPAGVTRKGATRRRGGRVPAKGVPARSRTYTDPDLAAAECPCKLAGRKRCPGWATYCHCSATAAPVGFYSGVACRSSVCNARRRIAEHARGLIRRHGTKGAAALLREAERRILEAGGTPARTGKRGGR